MGGKRTARRGRTGAASAGSAGRGRAARDAAEELLPDRLSARAMSGDRGAFLALVRFHSTFDPIPLGPALVAEAQLDEQTARKLLGRLKRREDSLVRPFPGIDMVFWGEKWVQDALGRFMWRRRGGKDVPDARFLGRLWDASREGAMLQLKIYRKIRVAASAWVRVKYPHFANLGLTDGQMLKIARAEGCRFREDAFLAAVRRFRRAGGV